MATFDFSATGFVASCKRRGFIPSSTQSLVTADILAIAQEELSSRVLPLVLSMMKEYYVTYADQSLVSGTLTYQFPARAVAMKAREVTMVASDGSIRNVPQVSIERLDQVNWGFYLQGNQIVLVADPGSSTELLRVHYYIRPNTLVTVAETAQIATINPATKQITTTATIPTTFGTTVTYDFVRATPGFEHRGTDFSASVASGTGMTFTSTLPTSLAVGDYVCLAGETPVPQLPAELWPLLVQLTTVRCLQAIGRQEMAEKAAEEALRMEADARELLAPRVDGEPQKIVNRSSLGDWVNRGTWTVLR